MVQANLSITMVASIFLSIYTNTAVWKTLQGLRTVHKFLPINMPTLTVYLPSLHTRLEIGYVWINFLHIQIKLIHIIPMGIRRTDKAQYNSGLSWCTLPPAFAWHFKKEWSAYSAAYIWVCTERIITQLSSNYHHKVHSAIHTQVYH